jgi:RNA polymerase sigma-70 factor (ECF subfamily)
VNNAWSNIPDDELMMRVASRDENAFLALYDRYASRVYALVLHILRDPQTAEEITQEAYLKVWTRARSYLPGKAGFAAWLLSIARNTALDLLRLERRRPEPAGNEDPEEIWSNIANGATTTEEARWKSLYFILQALPAEQRQVIELAFYHGMSHSEIAGYLELPLGTVKTRLRTGMALLRRQWLGQEVQDPASEDALGGVNVNRDE